MSLWSRGVVSPSGGGRGGEVKMPLVPFKPWPLWPAAVHAEENWGGQHIKWHQGCIPACHTVSWLGVPSREGRVGPPEAAICQELLHSFQLGGGGAVPVPPLAQFSGN